MLFPTSCVFIVNSIYKMLPLFNAFLVVDIAFYFIFNYRT